MSRAVNFQLTPSACEAAAGRDTPHASFNVYTYDRTKHRSMSETVRLNIDLRSGYIGTELSPAEARQLAAYLVQAADQAEQSKQLNDDLDDIHDQLSDPDFDSRLVRFCHPDVLYAPAGKIEETAAANPGKLVIEDQAGDMAQAMGASTDNDPQRSQPAEAGEVLRHVGGMLGGEAGAAVQEDLVAVGRPIPGQLAHQILAEGLREEDTATMVLAIFPEGDGECERLVLSVDRQVPPIRLPHEAVRQRDAQVVDLAAHVRALPKARIATLTGPQGCGKTSIAEPLRQLLGLVRIVEEGEGDPSALWYDGDLVVQATSQATWASEFVRDCRDDFSNRAEGC